MVGQACRVTLSFDRLVWPEEADAVVEFLSTNEWPFHTSPHLSHDQAASIAVCDDDIVTYWIRRDGEAIGMVRLLDLDDLDTGSPLFDLRISPEHRGHGVGRQAVRWLTTHFFTVYPALHRIEATTRHDNLAMQTVLDQCGFRLEGRLLEAWTNTDGTRYDTLIYAILRREWTAQPCGVGSDGPDSA